jgi:protein involved in sex pheromone biosynthesis
MKKLVVLSVIAPAMLGLAACGGTKVENTSDVTVTNTDDANLTETTNITDENVSDVTANASNAAE